MHRIRTEVAGAICGTMSGMRIALFIVAIAWLSPAMAEQPVSPEWRPPVELAYGEGRVGSWRRNEFD